MAKKRKLSAGLAAYNAARKAKAKSKKKVSSCYAKAAKSFRKRNGPRSKQPADTVDGYDDALDDIRDTCAAKYPWQGYL